MSVLQAFAGRGLPLTLLLLVLAVAISDQLTCSVLKPLVGRVRPCNALPPESVAMIPAASNASETRAASSIIVVSSVMLPRLVTRHLAFSGSPRYRLPWRLGLLRSL